MSRIGNKRRRTETGFVQVVSQKRPIDKGLIMVNQSTSTSQVQSGLVGATFPCTVTGLRWSLAYSGSSAASAFGMWAIIIVRDGLSASTLSFTDESTLYAPEQDVLAFGVLRAADTDGGTGPGQILIEGTTKTMRKLMGGDAILFITKMNANAGSIVGCVQMFCKS